jgi:hypothetical protein
MICIYGPVWLPFWLECENVTTLTVTCTGMQGCACKNVTVNYNCVEWARITVVIRAESCKGCRVSGTETYSSESGCHRRPWLFIISFFGGRDPQFSLHDQFLLVIVSRREGAAPVAPEVTVEDVITLDCQCPYFVKLQVLPVSSCHLPEFRASVYHARESTGILVQYPASPPRSPPSRRHYPPLCLPLGSVPTPSLYSHSRSLVVVPVLSQWCLSVIPPPYKYTPTCHARYNKEHSRRGSHQSQVRRYPVPQCLRDQITALLGLDCRRSDSPSLGTPAAPSLFPTGSRTRALFDAYGLQK